VTVEEINLAEYISIYPNPANDILTISCTNGASVEKVMIYNQTGQKVLEGELSKNNIDVSSLHPGLYFIHLQLGDQVKIRKIIKR